MLQSMRHLAHSWYFKGLMLLLVVSFGIWNVGDLFRGNPLRQTVATAGSDTFTVQQVSRIFDQNLARARQMFKPDLTAQQAKQMGMADSALNDLIENSLFDQDLKRLGINAGDQTILQSLLHEPQLQDKDGHFDKKILQGMLAERGLSERAFLDQQRTNLASHQLVDAFTTLPPAPQGLIDVLYQARGQKRILDIVTLDSASFHASDRPDDKDLQDYYQQNPKPFTTPESRGVTIALLSTDTIAKDITISDDQVRHYYDSKNDQLAEPEKRDLLQVILQDETKAKELAKAAQTSGNLAAAAKPTGHEIVPIDDADEDSLLPGIAKPVFALAKGGITDPIKTPLGWHIIQVRKITPPGVPSYDAIKEKLRTSIKADQAADTASRLVNQMDDELAGSKTLEDLAADMKLRLVKIAAIDANGKTPDGKEASEVPYKDDVVKAAFAQNNGETSPVMDDKNGTYYVVRTDQITPSAVKPYDQVKAEVTAAFKKQEQRKAAEAEADVIAKGLRDGKTAASFAGTTGVTVSQSQPLSLLGDKDATLPKSALPQIFALKKGEVAILPAEQGKQMVVRLASITPPAAKDDAAHGTIASDYTGSAPKEFADQFAKYLRVIFPVRIHTDAMDTIGQQG